MFFSSLPPFVVGMLEKDMGEDEVMAAPEAYDIFKKNSIFTVRNFFVWMGEAIYHSLGKHEDNHAMQHDNNTDYLTHFM